VVVGREEVEVGREEGEVVAVAEEPAVPEAGVAAVVREQAVAAVLAATTPHRPSMPKRFAPFCTARGRYAPRRGRITKS
jgi:hypothetical protein